MAAINTTLYMLSDLLRRNPGANTPETFRANVSRTPQVGESGVNGKFGERARQTQFGEDGAIVAAPHRHIRTLSGPQTKVRRRGTRGGELWRGVAALISCTGQLAAPRNWSRSRVVTGSRGNRGP